MNMSAPFRRLIAKRPSSAEESLRRENARNEGVF